MDFTIAATQKTVVRRQDRLTNRPTHRQLGVSLTAIAIACVVAGDAEIAHARKSQHPRGKGKGAAVCGTAPSKDPDAPTPLTSSTVAGCGIGTRVSYYYRFSADAGEISLTASGRNRPAASAGALGASLRNPKTEEICSLGLGNVNQTTTQTQKCRNPVPQAIILRLDLDPESVDYRVTLDGPIKLSGSASPGPQAAAAVVDEGLPSTDIDKPTAFIGPSIKGKGTNQATSYYFSLTVGPGEVTVTADGKNRSAAFASALGVTLQDGRAQKLCSLSLGNTTRDERKVVSCPVATRQTGILRVDLAPETIDWRVRVEGAVVPTDK